MASSKNSIQEAVIRRLTYLILRIPFQRLPGHAHFEELEHDLEDIHLWYGEED